MDGSLTFRRAAIVTGGAGGGIGQGITEALLSAGWEILIVDRDEKAATLLRERLRSGGEQAEFLVGDITHAKVPEQAVAACLKRFGRLDGLVNNAGIGLCKPMIDISDEDFDRLFDVDLRSAFRFCRAAIPHMRDGGAIVNIGSVHAHKSVAGYGLYGCVKAALEGLTRGVAIDYGAQGVRANCVLPGYVESPQNRELISNLTSDVDDWIRRYAGTKQLVDRVPTARQVGELVTYLMGSQAVAITGQTFTIDAGTSVMLYEREGGS
jgi:NAD(P)-dependent dehydrogenase (short-subunit alcohol dehydrogenase family)